MKNIYEVLFYVYIYIILCISIFFIFFIEEKQPHHGKYINHIGLDTAYAKHIHNISYS